MLKKHQWVCRECGLVLSQQRYSTSDYVLQTPAAPATPARTRKRKRSAKSAEKRARALFPDVDEEVLRRVSTLQELLQPKDNIDAFVVGCIHILKTGISKEGVTIVERLPSAEDATLKSNKRGLVTKGKNMVRLFCFLF